MKTTSGFVHVVEEGDTLYLLSKRYEVPLSAIFVGNPYVNVYDLRPGDEILIPGRQAPYWEKGSR